MDFHVSTHAIGWILILAPIMIIFVPLLIWKTEDTLIGIMLALMTAAFIGTILLAVGSVLQGLHILVPHAVTTGPFWQ